MKSELERKKSVNTWIQQLPLIIKIYEETGDYALAAKYRGVLKEIERPDYQGFIDSEGKKIATKRFTYTELINLKIVPN